MRKGLLLALSIALPVVSLSSRANAVVLISQYYEGTATNKWIELFNNGSTTINLTDLTVGLWSNANAEGYKTNVAASQSVVLSGLLAPGSTYVLGNSLNTTPLAAVANLNNDNVINFNGNDSIALYTTGVFSTANLIDAIGFTNAGTQGTDKSFVRTSSAPGFDTTSGSNVTNFGNWTQVDLATVNAASAGTDNFIGSSTSLTAVPEPFTVIGTLIGGVAAFRMRKQLKSAQK
jgi:predicted extracellular nuclease